MNRTKHDRIVALMLLVFALVGMATSQPTGEMGELLGFHPDGWVFLMSHDLTEQPQPSGVDNPQNQESHDTTILDDDSLCWCPHMLSGSSFVIVFSGIKCLANERPGLTLPSAPPQLLFHPPRFA